MLVETSCFVRLFQNIKTIKYLLPCLFLLILNGSDIAIPEAYAQQACKGWTYPEGTPNSCHESVFSVLQQDALDDCNARLHEINPNAGCTGPGSSHTYFGDTEDPTVTGHYRFLLSYHFGGYCQEPAILDEFSLDANKACYVVCPAERPFNLDLRSCEPEKAVCETCKNNQNSGPGATTGNPINYITGDKYQIETDYQAAGAFPLKIARYYHSHKNISFDESNGRTGWGYGSTATQGYIRYYEPSISFGLQRRYSAYTSAPNLNSSNDLFNDKNKYRGRLKEKWRHYYDRYLLASFSYMGVVVSEIPKNIQIYRPDGKVEYYIYTNSNGVYASQNGYTSTVARLPAEHELAPGWRVVNQSNEIEIYNIEGKLLRLTSLAGLSQHLTYDALTGSKLEKVEDDFGHNLLFEYGDSENPESPTKITDPDGNDYLYSYDARGLLVAISYPDETPGNSTDNPSKIYHYEDPLYPEALTGVTDENGDRYATYGYDLLGRAISTEHANGVDKAEVVFNTVNQTRTLTNALGKQSVVKLAYSGLVLEINNLESSSGLATATAEFTSYDSRSFVVRNIDKNGNQTRYVRDDRGLELSRIEAFGTPAQRTINTTWNSLYRLPSQIIEPGRTTSMTYDSLGHLLTMTEIDTTTQSIPYSTNGQSRTTTYSYYPAGVNGALQLSSVDGPRTDVNDITTYEYTSEGYLSKVTNALGHQIMITTHNAKGQPLSIIDENNVQTEFSYHPRGWLLSSAVRHPGQPNGSQDAITSYNYDDAGQVTKITLPDNSFLTYEYDAAHRLVGISNNQGERMDYVLDNAGNITSETIKNSSSAITKTQTRVFDELSRLYKNVGGVGQTNLFSYDGNNNLVETVADPINLNQRTGNAFDALNRLVSSTDALNGLSEFDYDKRNNLASVTDERGLTTNYIYDGFDNVILQDSPDSGITVYSYDKADNLISQLDARSIEKQFSYDVLNRVTLEHYPANSDEDIVYHYDQVSAGYGIGRLTTVDDQTGATSYEYDHRGNLVVATSLVAGNSYSTQYAYDLADNLVQTIYPSGRVVDETLDALGRTNAVTTRTSASDPSITVANNISYLPFGPASSLQYGNQISTTMNYDQDYRLTDIASGSGNTDILDLSYTLNSINNIEDIANNLDANLSQVFEYDSLNRLTGAGGIYGIINFAYDPVGNRISKAVTNGGNTLTQTYTYFQDSNSIQSITDGSNFQFYQYDANGNVRGDGSKNYFYNQQNRLVEAAQQ